jgi:hypothetical protein
MSEALPRQNAHADVGGELGLGKGEDLEYE